MNRSRVGELVHELSLIVQRAEEHQVRHDDETRRGALLTELQNQLCGTLVCSHVCAVKADTTHEELHKVLARVRASLQPQYDAAGWKR